MIETAPHEAPAHRLSPRLPAVLVNPSDGDPAPEAMRTVFAALVVLANADRKLTSSIRELARWTELPATSVWRAMRRLVRARLVRVVTLGNGDRESTWEIRWKLFPQTPVPPLGSPGVQTSQKPENLRATEDAYARSPLCRNAQTAIQKGETSRRALRDVVREQRRLGIRAGPGSVARTLAEIREALGTWTCSCFLTQGTYLGDDPEEFLERLKSEIRTAFAVALWREHRRGTYLAAWNSATADLIGTVAAMPEDDERLDAVVTGIACGETDWNELFAWIGWLAGEAFGGPRWRVERDLIRLRREEEALRAKIAAEQDRLTAGEARELLTAALKRQVELAGTRPNTGSEAGETLGRSRPKVEEGRSAKETADTLGIGQTKVKEVRKVLEDPTLCPNGHKVEGRAPAVAVTDAPQSAVDVSTTDPRERTPSEPRWTRFRPVRKIRPPITDPADLAERRAALLARLGGQPVGQTRGKDAQT